jgi:hypothetical protein
LGGVVCELLRPGLKTLIKAPVPPERLVVGRSLWRGEQGEPLFAGYALQPIVDTAYERFLTQQPINLSAETHFLTGQSGSEYPRQLTADLGAVANEIDLVSGFFIDAWCDQLAVYWSEPGLDGQSPWAWLAAYLRGGVSQSLAAARAAGQLTAAEVAVINASLGLGADTPGAGHAPGVQPARVLRHPAHPLPLLLIGGSGSLPVWVVYDPQQGFERFGSAAALANDLGEPATQAPSNGPGALPEAAAVPERDHPFTAWAGAVLEDHLARQRAMALRLQAAAVETDTFEAALNAFPAAVLLDHTSHLARTQEVQARMPQWLHQASNTDQFRYGLGLQRVLHAQRSTSGADFFAGIPTVEDYARRRLIQQIEQDHPQAPLSDLDDVQVSIFSRKDDELLTIAGGGGTVTYEEQTISLVDLSLLNTGGRPAGWLSISARPGKVLPAWLGEDSVLALVKRVDVGATYLALLQQKLAAGQQGLEHRRAFKVQVAAQLPLLALECKLRDGSLDEAGIVLVRRAFVSEGGAAAPVVGQLAFEATSGAAPDRVVGFFLLGGSEQADTLVLYAPLAPTPLRQFKDRKALMQAIIDEPQLQLAVMAGLTETAQVRYRNGGLQAPRWLRFGLGSEFAPVPAVAPARLVSVMVKGDPLDAFYDGLVQALTLAADRQTVSNQESAWITARQLSWLVFNQVLPFFSGAAASAGWLIQLGHSLDEQANAIGASGTPESFDNDELILDLALTLWTEGLGRALGNLAARGQGHSPGKPVPVPAAGAPVLDWSWSRPDTTLTQNMRRRLQGLALPEPANLPAAVPSGPFRGLILAGQRWLARVDGQLFEVAPGDGEARILQQSTEQAEGPWLRRDESGRWRLDLRLRLRGGGPKRRIEQQRELNEQLRAKADQYLQDIEQAYLRLRQAGTQGEQAIADAIRANDLAGARARRTQEQQRLEVAFQVSVRLRAAYEAIGKKITLPDYRKHLGTAMGAEINMCGYALNLAREALVDSLQANDAASFQEAVPKDMSAEQASRWFTFLHQQAVGVELAERWRDRLEDRLLQLGQIPVFGARLLEQFKPRFTTFRSQVEYQLLRAYVRLSLLEEPMLADQGARDAVHEAMTPLTLALNTHKELAGGLSLNQEQEAELLDGVITTYQGAQDTVQWLKQTLRPEYATAAMDDLVRVVGSLLEKAETRLGTLVKPQGGPAPVAKAGPSAQGTAGGTGQRVIRTRNRGPLVARVRKVQGGSSREIAEVLSPLSDSVVARFAHDPERDDWVQEPASATAPGHGTASRADVDRLVHEADRRLAHAARQLEQAPRLAQVTRIPVELEELMNHTARDLQTTAEGIEHALTRVNETDVAGSGYRSAEVKARALRDMAQRLTEQGRALRIRLTKTALPTAARVRYLVEQGEAKVRRLGSRIALKGQGKRKDIVQEYAVQEPGGATLWYAHFHYASLEAEDRQYLAAHLKTVSQRFVGLSTQMAQAGSNAEVVKIYRSRIDPMTAKALFLTEQ